MSEASYLVSTYGATNVTKTLNKYATSTLFRDFGYESPSTERMQNLHLQKP